MPNMLYPWCLMLGHHWNFIRKSRNYLHYECRMCGRRSKEER